MVIINNPKVTIINLKICTQFMKIYKKSISIEFIISELKILAIERLRIVEIDFNFVLWVVEVVCRV